MDIETFYDADPRRRASAEIELGSEWTDGAQNRYELSWVADTGEIYVMLEVAPPEFVDPFGDAFPEDIPTDQLTVAVLGTVATQDDVERIFAGWPDAMSQPDSVSWIARRLEDAGVRTAPLEGGSRPQASSGR